MYRTLAVTVSLVIAATVAEAQQPPLKTGVDGTFAPHAMPNLAGGIQGFNVDLANEIAKRLKRQITIDATQFSGLLPGLQAGTYDFIAAPTTVTKERAESLLFTEGYLNTDFQFVVKKDTPDIVKLEDLKGKTVSVNKGSAYDSWARELAEKIGWSVEFVRHQHRRGAGGDRRARLHQCGRQHGRRLGGEEQSRHQALLPAFDRPGVGGAGAQGQYRDAQEARRGDRMHEEGRHDRRHA